jgi:hypothetical protein
LEIPLNTGDVEMSIGDDSGGAPKGEPGGVATILQGSPSASSSTGRRISSSVIDMLEPKEAATWVLEAMGIHMMGHIFPGV